MGRIATRLRKLESDLQRIEQRRDPRIVVVEDPNFYGNMERLAALWETELKEYSPVIGWYGA